MLTILASTGRVLAQHWPSLIAWFLGGTLAHYLGIELAGTIGGYTSTGGMLLLPLAILAKLISFVAMFLVVRDGLQNLQRLAPLPEAKIERRRNFRDALLASILPFFAVYSAAGFLQKDVNAYSARSLEVALSRDAESRGEYGIWLSFNVLTVLVIIAAFTGRWAWKKYATRLPNWLSVVAVYLEGVWVMFLVFLLKDAIAAVTSWVDGRQAMVWLGDVREWFANWFAPINWAWDGIGWFIGQLGSVVLQPLAWLAIAGVIYGQLIAPEQARISTAVTRKAGERWARIPAPVRRRLSDFAEEIIGRFRPIWRAIVLMWRAGPVLIASYVLAYVLLMAMEALLGIVVTRIVGPHDLYTFWLVADQTIFLIVPFVVEPIRIALVAGSYDATLGALRNAKTMA